MPWSLYPKCDLLPFFVQITSLLLLFLLHFSRGLSTFGCPRSEWVKVAFWIIPSFIFKPSQLSWLCNYLNIYLYLQLSMILFLNNQTVILSGMYSGKSEKKTILANENILFWIIPLNILFWIIPLYLEPCHENTLLLAARYFHGTETLISFIFTVKTK